MHAPLQLMDSPQLTTTFYDAVFTGQLKSPVKLIKTQVCLHLSPRFAVHLSNLGLETHQPAG